MSLFFASRLQIEVRGNQPWGRLRGPINKGRIVKRSGRGERGARYKGEGGDFRDKVEPATQRHAAGKRIEPTRPPPPPPVLKGRGHRSPLLSPLDVGKPSAGGERSEAERSGAELLEEESAVRTDRGLSVQVGWLHRTLDVHIMTNEAMEDPTISSRERYIRFMENSCCTDFCLGPNPFMARYVYALLFLLASLLAWAIRDYGHSAISEFERLEGCHGARYCLGAEGVLRVSFGCFVSFAKLFFFVMFLLTAGTKKLDDPRNSWHSDWWPAKIIMWIGFMAVPFFIPPAFIQLYGNLAHFGAGAFLLIQLVSVISFITWLNDYCRSEKNIKRRRIQVLVLSITAYVASIFGIVLMYLWYAPKPTCRLNILFITLTLVLLQVMTFVSMHSKVKEGFLSPGLMGMYVVFLCWSAIRSEPQIEICNQKAAATSADWLTIVSFVIAVLVMVIATFSTGIDSKCFQFKKTEAESEDDIPYGYGFFHFVFAMGGMYFAMLFIGWNAHKTMHKWTIDVGWASTWVRIVNEWLATLVYVWMLAAPLVWKSIRRVESI